MKKVMIASLIALAVLLPTMLFAGGYHIFKPGFAVIRGGVADTTIAVTNMDAGDIVWGAVLIDTIGTGVVKDITSHVIEKADSVKIDTVTTAKYIILFWQNTKDD